MIQKFQSKRQRNSKETLMKPERNLKKNPKETPNSFFKKAEIEKKEVPYDTKNI